MNSTHIDAPHHPRPTCSCGSVEFRAYLTLPVTVHFSDTEETLEVTSLDANDLNFITVYCYDCGATTETSTTPAEDQALAEAREGMTDLLTEAFIMTPLR